jgi:uncharacterized protein YjiS (DUF1127 family)
MSHSEHSIAEPAARTDADTVARAFGRGVFAAFEVAGIWMERYRQRRALQALPDHLLHDIGVSRADALREGEKPFWQV